jgi:hypothetical protein
MRKLRADLIKGILVTMPMTIFCLPSYLKTCKTMVLPVVLCEHETCSLTISEGHGLRMFEKRVLRKIFAPKRDKEHGPGEYWIMRSLLFVLFT